MNKQLEYIVRDVLAEVLSEQAEQQKQAASVFDPAQQRFLGSFAAAGAQHLGIIYSVSEIGIREFVARSGAQYGCTPAVLLSLLRGKYIKIVPYTGYGRNTDYTIELQLPLDTVQPFAALVGKKDGEGDAAAGGSDTSSPSGGGGGSFGGGGGGLPPIGDTGGDLDLADAEGAAGAEAPPEEGEAPPEEAPAEEPGPEVAHVVKYGDLLKESAHVAKKMMLEASKSKKKSSSVKDIKIHLSKSRVLRRVPREFIYQLKRVIHKMKGRTYNKWEQERLIADIIDNLQVNFKLSDHQIRRAYEFHRNQKRLQKFLDED